MRVTGGFSHLRWSWMALAVLPLGAHAADGWYLGLEGGANWLESEDYRVYDYSAPLSNVPDGTRIARAKLDTGWLGGLAVGFAYPNGLRSEIELAYRNNDFKSLYRDRLGPLSSGGTTSDVDGGNQLATAMLNVWYDFFRSGSLHPYIGAGAGAGRLEINSGRWGNTPLRDRFDTRFAWQLGAGLAYELSPHWTASLDYRYLRLASDASFDLLENAPNTRVETDYKAQSAMLTLRYAFGSPAPAPLAPVAEAPVEVVPVEPPPAPPPPSPVCKQFAPGETLNLDGCKAGDKLVLHGVNFEFDKASLTVNAKTLLDQVVSELSRHPDIKVEIDGHTDSKGADAYNLKLSQRRADAVKAYLVAHGIAAERMTTQGYGETMPIGDNSTEDGREENRRVELKITEGGEAAAAASDTAEPLTLTEVPDTTPAEPVDPLAAPQQ
ncbi:OmpA family protein [Solimonas soli]|uniref:OmpA family protein n=1 Tax=Solimonas soli TaxID=413479 RepID=UPI0004B4B8F4|nr:acyloxyacyl hydrolase [Solimonas soli]